MESEIPSAEVLPTVDLTLDSQNSPRSEYGMNGLAEMGSSAEPRGAAIEHLMFDDNESVRRAAAATLAKILEQRTHRRPE